MFQAEIIIPSAIDMFSKLFNKKADEDEEFDNGQSTQNVIQQNKLKFRLSQFQFKKTLGTDKTINHRSSSCYMDASYLKQLSFRFQL